jgi:hypothetical protein
VTQKSNPIWTFTIFLVVEVEPQSYLSHPEKKQIIAGTKHLSCSKKDIDID